jgi:hypothetical protein
MQFESAAPTPEISSEAPMELGSKSDIEPENTYELREPPKHNELVKLHDSLQYLILGLNKKIR